MATTLAAVDRSSVLDHCGILAVVAPTDGPFFPNALAAHQELQTRGYDGAGFWALTSAGVEHSRKGAGMIREVFPATAKHTKTYTKLAAKTWIFQNRYGTSGDQSPENVQPLRRVHVSGEVFVVAHNGQFSQRVSTHSSKSDTVLFANALARAPQKTWAQRLQHTLRAFSGAYSLIVATSEGMYCARDRFGFRPLVYGRLTARVPHTWGVASESTSLHKLGCTHITEVMPGSIIKFSDSGVTVLKAQTKQTARAYCMFENVYIMEESTQAHLPTKAPVHIRNHPTVNLVRYRSGQILAEEAPVPKRGVDFVCGVPGTGISGAQGFANTLRIPYVQAIVDAAMPIEEQRTFMEADIDGILQKVATHFSFETDILRGKNIVLVDDSLVRGNVMTGLIQLLKQHCGVKTIHIRIVCPPIDKPCHLGISTRSATELLAHVCGNDVEKMRAHIAADSLAFLSVPGLKEAVSNSANAQGFCIGCMHGQVAPIDRFGKRQ